ncbi:MAG: hypothetical protein K2G88_09315, partial [Oscillospiraceae bacterium]|nr:hypothetical protein [Oscillospiraceae bacterium]
MKRLISTLTALCMCASMSVGVLPASALTALSSDDAVLVNGLTVQADATTPHDSGFEFSVTDATYDPAVGGNISLPITVWNPVGIAGYAFQIAVDGKTVDSADCPFEIASIDNAFDAYYDFDTFSPNAAIGKLGGSGDGDDVEAENGSTVCTFVLKVKDGATLKGPGEKYKVTLEGLDFSDHAHAKVDG